MRLSLSRDELERMVARTSKDGSLPRYPYKTNVLALSLVDQSTYHYYIDVHTGHPAQRMSYPSAHSHTALRGMSSTEFCQYGGKSL